MSEPDESLDDSLEEEDEEEEGGVRLECLKSPPFEFLVLGDESSVLGDGFWSVLPSPVGIVSADISSAS